METTLPNQTQPTLPVEQPSKEEKQFCNIIGELVEQWGFNRHLGHVWGLLYLNATALNPNQIQEKLHLSSSNTNTILNELLAWGVIKRVNVPNDRKFYYQVEDHIWKSISNVIKAREFRVLGQAIEQLQNLQAQKTATPYQGEQMKHILNTLGLFQTLGSTLLNASDKQIESIGKIISKLKGM